MSPSFFWHISTWEFGKHLKIVDFGRKPDPFANAIFARPFLLDLRQTPRPTARMRPMERLIYLAARFPLREFAQWHRTSDSLRLKGLGRPIYWLPCEICNPQTHRASPLYRPYSACEPVYASSPAAIRHRAHHSPSFTTACTQSQILTGPVSTIIARQCSKCIFRLLLLV